MGVWGPLHAQRCSARFPECLGEMGICCSRLLIGDFAQASGFLAPVGSSDELGTWCPHVHAEPWVRAGRSPLRRRRPCLASAARPPPPAPCCCPHYGAPAAVGDTGQLPPLGSCLPSPCGQLGFVTSDDWTRSVSHGARRWRVSHYPPGPCSFSPDTAVLLRTRPPSLREAHAATREGVPAAPWQSAAAGTGRSLACLR